MKFVCKIDSLLLRCPYLGKVYTSKDCVREAFQSKKRENLGIGPNRVQDLDGIRTEKIMTNFHLMR